MAVLDSWLLIKMNTFSINTKICDLGKINDAKTGHSGYYEHY